MYWTEWLDGGVFGEVEYEFEVPDERIWEHIEDEIVDHVIGYCWEELLESLTAQSNDKIEELIRELSDVIGPARLGAIMSEIQNEEDDD